MQTEIDDSYDLEAKIQYRVDHLSRNICKDIIQELAEEKVKERKERLISLIKGLKFYQNKVRSLGPDVINYDALGNVVCQTYSENRNKERNYYKDKCEWYENVIYNAINNLTYDDKFWNTSIHMHLYNDPGYIVIDKFSLSTNKESDALLIKLSSKYEGKF